MKSTKENAAFDLLRQNAVIIKNKKQLNQLKGGDGLGADDMRSGLIGSEDFRDS